MRYDELTRTVQDSNRGEWTRPISHPDEELAAYQAYTGDVLLNLKVYRDPTMGNTPFNEWWTKSFAPSLKYVVEIRYASVPVRQVYVVSVDGGHGPFMPLPDPKTKRIAPDEYRIAKLLDDRDILDDYTQRAGLSVP